MVRNLLCFSRSWAQIALLVGFGISSSHGWALGLGEIELSSALNEKLNARVELIEAVGMLPTEILVTLASREDFERVGVERFFYLTSLQFEVVLQGNRAWINVTSRKPIAEPYLNFLVQVHWPNGRLLKEYTLLLDPPTYGQAAAPSVSAPQQEAAVGQTTGRIERPAAAQTAPTPRTAGTQVDLAPRTTERASMPAGEGEFRMTDRNDTLWKIASTTRRSDRINMQQQMLALQRINPEAFIRNNINLLKAGYILRIPTESEALSLSRSDAALEVAVQNEAWRNPERVASSSALPSSEASQLRSQVDATRDAESPAASAEQGEGQLRIVAGEGDSVVGSETPQVDSQQVAAALEERDRLTREVDELTYQLDRQQALSTNQLEVKDRQLEVQNQQIAELQAQLASTQQAAEAAAQQAQNQSAATPEAEPWWQSTPVLGGAAAVLVLGLVGGLVTARRRRTEEVYEEAYHDESDATDVEAELAVLNVDADDAVDEVDATATDEDTYGLQVDDLEDDEAEDVVSEDVLADEGEEVLTGSQTGDVIGEADIYIAYGRYPQAISLLLGVLDEDSGRNDVRLKLLECYVETTDRAGFDTQMTGFVESCEDEEALLTARELESRLSESEIVSGSDTESTAPATVDESLDDLSSVEEFDLKLDELEPAEESEPESESEPEPEPEPESESESETEPSTFTTSGSTSTSGLEFELELDEQPLESDEAVESEEGMGDDLGGDLGMDFDPDAAPADVTEATAEVEAAADAETDGLTLEATTSTDSDSAEEAETPEIDDGFSLDDLDVDEDADSGADESDFDFEEEGDSASTKLDLARAYIDMGDEAGARDILSEVLSEGNDTQQQQAQELLDQI
ncbi:MAG: hypothetical protein O7C67_10450 [Gammaproteobacteria bacterium]|nr:hypothetical protein [Gammaproteobacteria bacterium]